MTKKDKYKYQLLNIAYLILILAVSVGISMKLRSVSTSDWTYLSFPLVLCLTSYIVKYVVSPLVNSFFTKRN